MIETDRTLWRIEWAGWLMDMRLHWADQKEVGEWSIRPRALAVQFGWPQGGYVWQTPIDVHVVKGEYREHLWTLNRTHLALAGIGLLSLLVIWKSSSDSN
jgi:hypothetical protein